jgi:hypothetical protein
VRFIGDPQTRPLHTVPPIDRTALGRCLLALRTTAISMMPETRMAKHNTVALQEDGRRSLGSPSFVMSKHAGIRGSRTHPTSHNRVLASRRISNPTTNFKNDLSHRSSGGRRGSLHWGVYFVTCHSKIPLEARTSCTWLFPLFLQTALRTNIDCVPTSRGGYLVRWHADLAQVEHYPILNLTCLA